ncbi:MAG: c-type cytochrome [Terriglobales bacterium]|jgi:mono/diheme cytochrome c family protein
MLSSRIRLLGCASVLLAAALSPRFEASANSRSSADSSPTSLPRLVLHPSRSSTSDLELGGELAGLPPGSNRYISRDQLLAFPQVSYTVTDDANFKAPVQISGVSLEELILHLAAAPASAIVVAICDDQYRANYPRAYVAAHRPVLVLTINGQPPSGWPKDAEGHGQDLGPFLISHPTFTPSFKIFAHADEAQIPWGVVRLELRSEKRVLDSIAPRGAHSADKLVQDGYRIAQQNCFRCHNSGKEGGTKAGHPWLVLSAWATASPEYFAAYIRHPQSRNPNAQMPGNPGYDDATIAALVAYFRAFAPSRAPMPSATEKQ